MAAMLASCSEVVETQQVEIPESHEAAIAGQTPVLFGAYTTRNITRGGVTGTLSDDAMRDVNNNKFNDAGFGVFGYYTDAQDYSAKSVPNFMYNQQVTTADGTTWTYDPVKYWPNEYGDNAQSKDEDKVSFFAYAPFVTCDPATGKVDTSTDATADQWGITGFSKNNAAGDPFVKYIASFDLSKSVDLLYGTVHADSNPWNTLTGTQQTLVNGLPFIDMQHPAEIEQKMKFNFLHALAQLNVQIDVDADIAYHLNNTEAGADAATKVYVRSISFKGFAMKGALNLNNQDANVARWMNYNGQGELTYDNAETVIVNDGRKNGKEGTTAAATEKNALLNPNIISNDGNTTVGVLDTLQNLFKPYTPDAVDPENPTAQELADAGALKQPVMVIPVDESEPITVTIVYDVETTDANLATTLSDGTKGSRVRNEITKEVDFGGYGLRSGRRHTLYLHLGLNSVKFEAAVSGWANASGSGNAWLPDNVGNGNEGISNPGNTLGITLLNGAASTAVGGDATSAAINGIMNGGAKNYMTVVSTGLNSDEDDDETAAPDWMVENLNVIAVKSADNGATPSRAGTRGTVPDGYSGTVNGAHSVYIAPVGAGTTTLHSTLNGKESTIVITVVAPTLVLDKTAVTVYSFGASSPSETVNVSYTTPTGYTGTEPTTSVAFSGYEDYISSATITDDVLTIIPKDNIDSNTAVVTVSDTDGNSKDITVTIKKAAITASTSEVAVVKGKKISSLVFTGTPAFDDETYIKSVSIVDDSDNESDALTYDTATGIFTAKSDLNADATGKIKVTYSGHADSNDPVAEVSFTVLATDVTAMKADAQAQNPLFKVAQYNVAANGTSFVTSHSTNNQYVFTFADANNPSKVSISGYHVPTLAEQVSIIPSTSTTSGGTNWFNTAKTTATAFPASGNASKTYGKGWYLNPVKNDLYAVRQFDSSGSVLTAWHYKWTSSPCNGLSIESYVLDVAESVSIDDAYMKKVLSALPNSEVWTMADANETPTASSTTSSLVYRFLPACGRGANASENEGAFGGSGIASKYVGSSGYYWSSTDGTGSKAFNWDFNSGNMHEYFNAQEYAFSVRLFRDN